MSPRVLLVVPANNSTMEPEIAALCPELGAPLVARVPRPPRMLTREDIPAYADATVASVEPFADQDLALVVYGCTAAGFLSGPDGNARMVDALHRATGAPVVSTADAMIQALDAAGATRISVVTPYLKPVNDGLTAYLEASGITVRLLSSFEAPTTEALGRITEDEVYERALATVSPGEDEALFIACSQLPTLGIVPRLRERLGLPVWSSILATAWAGARRISDAGPRMRILDEASLAA